MVQSCSCIRMCGFSYKETYFGQITLVVLELWSLFSLFWSGPWWHRAVCMHSSTKSSQATLINDKLWILLKDVNTAEIFFFGQMVINCDLNLFFLSLSDQGHYGSRHDNHKKQKCSCMTGDYIFINILFCKCLQILKTAKQSRTPAGQKSAPSQTSPSVLDRLLKPCGWGFLCLKTTSCHSPAGFYLPLCAHFFSSIWSLITQNMVERRRRDEKLKEKTHFDKGLQQMMLRVVPDLQGLLRAAGV